MKKLPVACPLLFFMMAALFAAAQTDIKPAWLASTGVAPNGGYIYVNNIAATNDGSVYAAGVFTSTGNFDLGPGTYNLSAQYAADMFVAKYGKEGKIIFAFRLSGNSLSYGEYINSITTDSAGSLYITGYYSGDVDFDPGPAVFHLPPVDYYEKELFFAKYDSAGNFLFAKDITGPNDHDDITTIATDKNSNIYIGGLVRGRRLDFDPGPGTAYLPDIIGNDGFFAKYDAKGNYVFVKSVGGNLYDLVNDICVDKESNVLITGYFESPDNDFDPGAGVVKLSYSGGGDLFFAKYDSAGNYVFAHSIGGTNKESGNSIATDAENNVIIGGIVSGKNVDFDPGPGSALRNAVNNRSDVFLAKYKPDGSYLFADVFGGVKADVARDVAVDKLDNIYIGGNFDGRRVDFDPGPGIDTFTSKGNYDVFFAKYTPGGKYIKAFQVGGAGYDYLLNIALRGDGKLSVAGSYAGSVDVDPSAAVDTLTSATGNTFLATYDSNGSLSFAGTYTYYRSFTITSSVTEMATDEEGSTYITGPYQGKMDFDPGPDTVYLTSLTDATNDPRNGFHNDIYFAKYDKNGKLVYAKSIGGSSLNSVNAITVDASHNVYLCGFFGNRADFDPGRDSVILTSNKGYSWTQFLAKYDANGNYVFAEKLQLDDAYGGDANAIVTDAGNNIYIAGSFHKGTFNPADTTVVTRALGRADLYFAKYNSLGKFIYVKSMGRKDSQGNSCTDIKITPDGELAICGSVYGTAIDFDPGPGVYLGGSNSETFLHYIAGYTLEGDFIFENNPVSLLSRSYSGAAKIAFSGTDFFVTGTFAGAVDFDPGTDSSVGRSETTFGFNTFIAKYTNKGRFVFGKYLVPVYNGDFLYPDPIVANSIAVDAAKNIYIAGHNQGKIDMDPGKDTAYLYPFENAKSNTIFLAKYDSSGNYSYAYQLGATDTFLYRFNDATDCRVDSSGTIRLAGYVDGNVDFDPGTDTFFLHPSYNYTTGFYPPNSLFVVSYLQPLADRAPRYLYTRNLTPGSATPHLPYLRDKRNFKVLLTPKETSFTVGSH